eukprot:986917-Prymnesium_polylepis.1
MWRSKSRLLCACPGSADNACGYCDARNARPCSGVVHVDAFVRTEGVPCDADGAAGRGAVPFTIPAHQEAARFNLRALRVLPLHIQQCNKRCDK